MKLAPFYSLLLIISAFILPPKALPFLIPHIALLGFGSITVKIARYYSHQKQKKSLNNLSNTEYSATLPRPTSPPPFPGYKFKIDEDDPDYQAAIH